MLLHLKSLLYKEALLLRRDPKRLFVEFALPLILAVSMYASMSATQPIEHPESTKLNEGYESSSETSSDFSPYFRQRYYGSCVNQNKYLGLVSNDPEFTALFTAKLHENAPIHIKEFQTVEKLKEYAENPTYNKTISGRNELCLGISFERGGANNHKYTYTLFVDKDNGTQSQEHIYDDSLWVPDIETFSSLKYLGTFQTFIDSIIAKMVTNDTNAFVSYVIAPMHVKAYKKSLVPTYTLVNMIVLYSIICATLSLQFLIPRLQTEKVNKIRDFMRMMGMKDSPYYLSYFLFHMATSFVVAGLLSGFMRYMVLKNTNFIAIFVGTYLLQLTAFPFAVMINAIFKSVQAAKTTGTLIYILGYVLLYPLTLSVNSYGAKVGFSFMPPMAYFFSTSIIYEFDTRESFGLADIGTNYQGYSVGKGWLFMIIDMIIFMALGLYLDNVLPGMGGVRHPWYYFLTSEYWCPKKRSSNQIVSPTTTNNDLTQLMPEHALRSPESEVPLFEEADPAVRSQEISGECLSIKGMTKVFDDGKAAVNKVSLNIYKGQVFILLGHNGAGKTTALSMLTGLLAPTSGQAYVQGTNIFEENEKLKGMLGICPQESIFYEKLTVEEHLKIFSGFKGVDYETQKATLMDLMTQLDFHDSANVAAEVLSGGQKRKLSVLLSLIGNPTILMLDEPTSGLDVSARKKIWEVVNAKKKDVILLMTTHYMDEAETLGDRIAIMSEGEIKCCGSPLFLKNRFGTGYQLTLVKELGFTEKGAASIIGKYAPNYQVKSQNQAEIVYNLPFDTVKDFSRMFTELDENLGNIAISSYGVAITSLEDVFLKVGEENKKDRVELQMQESEIGKSYSLSVSHQDSVSINVGAVLGKVWTQTLRTPRLLVVELILPFCLFLFALMNTAHTNSYDYTYGPEAIPIPKFVPMNDQTWHGDSTADLLFGFPENYIYRPLNVERQSDLPNMLLNYDKSVFSLSNKTTLFGAFYIESFKSNELQALILGNSIWPHVPTLFSNILTNAFLKSVTKDKSVQVTMNISPITMYKETITLQTEFLMLFMFAIYTGLAFAIPPASIAYSLVKERKTGEKSQQLIHGLSVFEFWTGRFIADYTKLLIPVLAVIILKAILDLQLPYYEFVLLVSMTAILPSAYLLHFLFNDEDKAMTFSNLIFTLLGLPAAIVLSIFKLLYFAQKSTFIAFAIPDLILRIIPLYNLVATLTTAVFSKLLSRTGYSVFEGAFDFYYLGEWLLMTAISLVAFWFFIWLVERCSDWKKKKDIAQLQSHDRTEAHVKDDDVLAEEAKVKAQPPESAAVQVKRARKMYEFLKAVDDVSFSVNQGDVFALLGVNGAGKTTVFKMITLQEKPTCGTFYINGINMHSMESGGAKKFIGYCAQDNILFEVLSVKEHLEFYAKIKGIPTSLREDVIQCILNSLNFGENLNKAAWKLSGGNKRKLCTAIALLGHPSVLLLDEPTTGLDPKNKRDVWQVISDAASRSKRCGVVVTTHSMEEVEALASKVGIMVKGNFRCFGPVQHLKSKYGNTYDLEFKVASPSYEKVRAQVHEAGFQEDAAVTTMSEAQRVLEKMEMLEEAGLIASYSPRALHITDKLIRGVGVKVWTIVEFGLQEKTAKEIKQWVNAAFGMHELVEHSQSKLKLRVPRMHEGRRVTFANLFAFAEKVKDEGLVGDYAVCETTLEHIFQYFARQDSQEANRDINH